jgi:steroid 5-alpha reductase family enzyme
MFLFVAKVVLVSIAVSLLARWANLIPRYPKLRYRVLFQVLNSGLLTVLLSLLITAGFNPPWTLLLVLLVVVLWGAVLCTNYIVRRAADAEDEPG